MRGLAFRLVCVLSLFCSIAAVSARATCTVPSFRTTTSFSVGDVPNGVAAADLNADGHPDLAVINSNTDSVSILLGNGAGSFAAQTTLVAGDSPTGIVTGDFNRDGRVDLAVANFFSDNISIFLGNGNGTFGTATNFALGNQPTDLAVGDFNQDGKLDLAGVRLSGTTIAILTGDGAGAFSAPATVSLNGSVGGRSIKVADFNLDGKQDLAVVGANASNQGDIVLLNGNGTGGFTFGSTVNVTAQLIEEINTGDLNMDGRPDVIAGNTNTGGLSVLLGNGTGIAGPTNLMSGARVLSVSVGDYNGDGKPDVAAGLGNSSDVAVLLGNGGGTLAAPVNFNIGASAAGPFGIAAADVNSDGRLDFVVSNNGLDNIAVRLSTCGGMTVRPSTDFDGDGKADIAIFRPSEGNWYTLFSSTGSFGVADWGASGDIPDAGDYDGDQKTDFAVFRPATGDWFVLRSSDGGFTTTQFGQNGDQAVANDYDGDGKTDIAIFRPASGSWFVLKSSDGQLGGAGFGLGTDIPIK